MSNPLAGTGDRSSHEFTTRAGIPVLRWPALESLGAEVVVTTRHGGVSEGPYRSLNLGLHVGDLPDSVIENRRRAAATIGADLGDLVLANQVHGNEFVAVGPDDRGRGSLDFRDVVADADVLLTTEPGPVLVTLVADCAPIVLIHPQARLLVTVHAGWRGTVAGAVTSALGAIVKFGGAAEGVTAAVGPVISPTRYLVGPEVAELVTERFGSTAPELLEPVDDNSGAGTRQFHLDVGKANVHLLQSGGVPPEQILVSDVTTDDADLFFSDRATRPCGRFGLFARLQP